MKAFHHQAAAVRTDFFSVGWSIRFAVAAALRHQHRVTLRHEDIRNKSHGNFDMLLSRPRAVVIDYQRKWTSALRFIEVSFNVEAAARVIKSLIRTGLPLIDPLWLCFGFNRNLLRKACRQ